VRSIRHQWAGRRAVCKSSSFHFGNSLIHPNRDWAGSTHACCTRAAGRLPPPAYLRTQHINERGRGPMHLLALRRSSEGGENWCTGGFRDALFVKMHNAQPLLQLAWKMWRCTRCTPTTVKVPKDSLEWNMALRYFERFRSSASLLHVCAEIENVFRHRRLRPRW